jgi:hypothetical protein
MRPATLLGDRVCMKRDPHHEGSLAREVHHLEQVADVGESDKTPLILVGRVWLACAVVVIAILALTLVVARIAT